MAQLCRTCGQEAEHTRELFDKGNSEILNNIRKVTGIWITQRPGVPTGICLSCLLDLNEAVAFRECCIKTNNLWFGKKDNRQVMSSINQELEQPTNRGFSPEKIELKIVPLSSFNPQKDSMRRNIQPNQSKVTDDPTVEVMDPIMISIESIKVENEPLSDTEAEDSKNKTHSRDTEGTVPLEAKPRSRRRKNIDEPAKAEFLDPIVICTETIKLEIEPDLLETEPKDIENHAHSEDKEEIVPPKTKRRGRPRKEESIKKSRALPKRKRDQKVTKTSRSQTARVNAKELEKFFCEHCGKSFSEKGNLNTHLQRHTGVKQFECEVCGRKEYSKHLLKLHVRIKHQGELPYVCKYCGLRFGNCNLRLVHERKHYPQHREYKCTVCDKGFREKKFLKNHAVVHTGERPYHCETCQTDFGHRNSFRAHLRSIRHQKKVEEQQKNPENKDDRTLSDSSSTHGRGRPSLGPGNRSVNIISLVKA